MHKLHFFCFICLLSSGLAAQQPWDVTIKSGYTLAPVRFYSRQLNITQHPSYAFALTGGNFALQSMFIGSKNLRIGAEMGFMGLDGYVISEMADPGDSEQTINENGDYIIRQLQFNALTELGIGTSRILFVNAGFGFNLDYKSRYIGGYRSYYNQSTGNTYSSLVGQTRNRDHFFGVMAGAGIRPKVFKRISLLAEGRLHYLLHRNSAQTDLQMTYFPLSFNFGVTYHLD